ncbi:MAG TPA: response regulator [Candidatus Acidoferrum sp.]|nr:response regulator [Candidatus Acidoferrum sp.]
MDAPRDTRDRRGGSFELLAELTSRLASTARLDDVAGSVLDQIAALGFGMVWMASFDQATGHLVTVKEVIDGGDAPPGSPEVMLDARRPIGRSFHQRRMVNIQDPEALYILDDESEPVPPGALLLPRAMYDHLHGSPFACGPLLGSHGQPVGAVGLSAYHGRQRIPDDLLHRGLLRSLTDHLGIATERALLVSRLERMEAELVRVQEAIHRDARLKAVGELAGVVAHDINNLSAVSLLAASTGLRSPSSATEVLPPIQRANRAIGDLIARLQRVARAASDGAAESEAANPCEVVQDILLMLAPVLREHSIAVELETAAPVSPVRASPALLHQVMLNLVLNARDALGKVPPDRRRLRVAVRDQDGRVSIVVSDSGPGIAPEAQRRLFQPFVTTKGPEHVGLGLAGARAALERAGGRLTGHNQPSGGARFEVVLERAVRRDAARSRPDRAARRASGRAASASAEVLIVDDDRDLVEVVRAFLAPQGYRVTKATSATEALDLAAQAAFALILCDVGMPRLGGVELCRELRRAGFSGKTVLMTGWNGDDLEARLPAAEYDRLLTKPFSGADLLEAIESALAG